MPQHGRRPAAALPAHRALKAALQNGPPPLSPTRLHRRKYAPGCYCLNVQASVPQHIEEILDSQGIRLPPPQ